MIPTFKLGEKSQRLLAYWRNKMEETTENNDGVNLPEKMDESKHSEDFSDNPNAVYISSDHISDTYLEDNELVKCVTHHWKRGILPGNVHMKSCKKCGETVVPIDFAEWLTLG